MSRLKLLEIQAQTLPASQDSYFAAGVATNFGSLPTLSIGGASQYQGLVQFDLSALPAGVTGGTVAKATLILFVNKIGTAGPINIDLANGPWTEGAVNGTNNPVQGAIVAAGVSVNSANTYITIDATQAVKNWLDNITLNQGFLIMPAAAGTSVFFDTKESTSTSHPPELQIVLTGPAGPTGAPGTIGPTGPAGPAGPNVLQAGSAASPSLSFINNSIPDSVLGGHEHRQHRHQRRESLDRAARWRPGPVGQYPARAARRG